MRILVVDDQSTMRRIIVRMLNRLGHMDCLEASNGREALELLETAPVDVVITDWRMPGMDGLQLLQALRAKDATKRLPVLFITSNAEEDHVLAAIGAGAASYLVKPINIDRLKGKMDMIAASVS
jgi:two-component system chemotaxis response regulator CheY